MSVIRCTVYTANRLSIVKCVPVILTCRVLWTNRNLTIRNVDRVRFVTLFSIESRWFIEWRVHSIWKSNVIFQHRLRSPVQRQLTSRVGTSLGWIWPCPGGLDLIWFGGLDLVWFGFVSSEIPRAKAADHRGRHLFWLGSIVDCDRRRFRDSRVTVG